MSTREPFRFRKHDLTRALRAAQAAGIDVGRIEVDPSTGKIAIIPKRASGDERLSDLDRELAAFEARNGQGESQGRC